MDKNKKAGFWSILKTYLYILIIYPVIKEIKGRKRRGYLISKKEKLNFKLISEYIFLFAALGFMFLISYKCMS